MKLLSTRRIRRNTIAIGSVGVIAAAAFGVLPAEAAVPFASAAFSGSATGAAVHLDLGDGSANVDVAPASAAVNSKGLSTAGTSEVGGVVSPAAAAKNSYARGAGLDLLGAQIAGLAEAAALPNASDVQELGPVPLDPVAYASLVRGTAAAKWNTETCLLGEDISRGLGFAANVQLVDTASDEATEDLDAPLAEVQADDPTRNVVQTVSRETLVPNADGTFGLRSQVSQTLAPITIADSITIEVLGEWVLSATATGLPGKSTVSYLPSKTDAGEPVGPLTPVLRIIQPGENPGDPAVTTVLALQDILGDEGLSIPIPGVAEITIGENPRAIGGDTDSSPSISSDGTSVSAAVDVVRVTLLDGSLADIRVGHMEVKATVPSGGIICPVPVSKKATPSIVNSTTAPDGKFQVAITIKNSFACDLINVSATDEITRKAGNVTFRIEEDDSRNDPKKGSGATFSNKSTTSATATYANLGTIPAGGSKVLNVVIGVTSGSGEIQDIATAKGTLSCSPTSAIGQASVALSGSFTLITTVARVLARTGGEATLALLFAGAAVTSAAVRRVLRRRSTS